MVGIACIFLSLVLLMYLANRGVGVLLLTPLKASLAALFSSNALVLASHPQISMNTLGGFTVDLQTGTPHCLCRYFDGCRRWPAHRAGDSGHVRDMAGIVLMSNLIPRAINIISIDASLTRQSRLRRTTSRWKFRLVLDGHGPI